MALRKPVAATEETAVAAETPAAVETPAVETAAATPQAAPESPKQEADKPAPAPAVRKSSAPAAAGQTPSFFRVNEVTQQVIDEAVSGDFPQLVATSGTFKISGEKTDVGNEISFYAMGVKRKWVCAPNEQGDEAKEFFSAAYDGDLAKDGKTIDELVEDALAAGFLRAKKAEYLDVFVEIVDHSNKKFVDLRGETMVLQLSFMSMKEWKSFANGLRIKFSWGDVDLGDQGSPLLKANSVATANKAGNDYSKFVFSLA